MEALPLESDFLNILRRSTDLLRERGVRDEFFSNERLEQYASELAAAFKVKASPTRGRSILPELKQSGKQLLLAYLNLADAIQAKEVLSPAAEWFVDNFHIIEDQLREIKRDLPKDYYNELPKLSSGELKGFPRVYAIALAIIARTDSRLDAEMLELFLHAYQKTEPLRIGELWAIAITLRIALVQHLTPLALRIINARQRRSQADATADRLLELAAQPETQPDELVEMLSLEIGRTADLDRAFVVQLTQRLRDQDSNVLSALDWLEKQLEHGHNTTTLEVTELEHYRQATAQATVGNIIMSMRLLSAMDWRKFVENVSLVDPILAEDPVGAYSKMDFATRDQYRHSVERISKRSKFSELKIARRAVEMATQSNASNAVENPINEKSSHIGYYLIGDGVPLFQRAVRYRPRLSERVSLTVRRYPTFFYLGSLSVLTAAFLIPVWHFGFWFCLLALIPASEFALSIVNHNVTFFLKPKQLPKLDCEQGIPEDARTMVVIPTLFTKESVVRDLLDSLQVHYLANKDPFIYFALLGDFADADKETTPGEEFLVKIAQEGIDELNARYASKDESRFYLFHRHRKFNLSEGKWIGYERKRGKLHEFNRLLRGATDTDYYSHKGNPKLLSKIQYVITLDSDTQLPRGAAHKLIGTILHPLNRPYLDPKSRRVTSGYGILQPRISVSLVSANRSRFARLFSGNTGLDPYTTACSDVYQDLFGEGSYTGKGLYVIDVFEEALLNRVPENSVLSHDLFEGSFARSGLVTDVELIDEYPTDYDAYLKRQHRWIRGDWQIGEWLLPLVPTSNNKRTRNTLPLSSRWKIIDNLRRSTVPPAVFLWLLLAWTVLPGSPLVWTAMIVLMFVFPVYANVTNSIFHHRQGVSWRGHARLNWVETVTQTQQILLLLAFLGEQSWNQMDAIVRVLYRKNISKKKLLEWVTFAQVQDREQHSTSFWRSLGVGFITAVAVALLIFAIRPAAFVAAAPFLIAWAANPFIKSWVKGRPRQRKRSLLESEIQELRLYARLTWHFFETFVQESGHWLAPDNFQEEPKPVVAHRTSPTNIGLQLISLASAYDFGYVGKLEFIEISERVFLSLGKLAKMHGHFFNWYSTETLEPLLPQYISTVDSGNLAGHLLALKQAYLELMPDLVKDISVNRQAKAGLTDTLLLVQRESLKIEDIAFQDAVTFLLAFLTASPPASSLDFDGFLQSMAGRLREVDDMLNALGSEAPQESLSEARIWLNAAMHQVKEFQRDLDISSLDAKRVEALMGHCDEIALGMNFKFLFDEQRKIFVIGYNVAEGRRDNSYYDLLASESRLASFIAIAKGEIPQEHWFRLGRQVTAVKGGRALISWTATMFEYLMPLLVMRRYEDTLLDQTYESVVARQIEYGSEKGVPWGISEAGYNARDLQLIYQYGPFGVPGLGLKRGLSDDLVISPYSTMLAAMIDPASALINLRSLDQKGALARYGFYESIDYTSERLPKGQKSFILRSFMAHHQGMSLVSMNNLLNNHRMQRRFHLEPLVQATQLLLQERIPPNVSITRPRAEEVHYAKNRFLLDSNPRVYTQPDLPTPRTQLLSNGTYSVMVTSAGGGYSRSGPYAVSRWREDVTRDHWGQFFYIRNRAAGRLWSSGFQPTAFQPKKYEVTFAEDKVEVWRRDGKTDTHTEIIVSPEDNAELRRISLTNKFTETREFEVTSFLEVVLALPADDAAHPAFSNLFVQTEFSPAEGALLATRRLRSKTEPEIWGFHVLATQGNVVGPIQYETDRAQFLGRGRGPSNALVIAEDRLLSNTVGPVLDPIFSLRQTIRIPPGETMRICFATGVARSREEALRLADKYRDIHSFARDEGLGWTKSRVQLRHLNVESDRAHTYQRLAGRIIFSDPSLRPRSKVLAFNTKTQSGLWAYGISGDFPIILARIKEEKDINMVRELLHGHEYLRLKGLLVDLVILNERAMSYVQLLQEELQRQIRMSGSKTLIDKPGGIFICRADIMPKEDVVLLKAIARVDLNAEKGTLDKQLMRRPFEHVVPGPFVPRRMKRAHPKIQSVHPKLEFFNGLGGFTSGGRHYVTVLEKGQWTPAPWVNVVANSLGFGFLISESGGGYTWSENSRENKLTPWSNDAVSDPVGEVIYIRDDETGEFWTPTPLPIREKETYVIKHGQGYTEFDHTSHGISSELQMFVPLDASVKISYLRLKNKTEEPRQLSVVGYAEWVLGVQRATSAPTVVTESDSERGIIFARNLYNNEFNQRVAFFAMNAPAHSFTCDRKAFLGRNGNPARPAAMGRERLSGLVGGGLDPCAALQTRLELEPGEECEIVFLLGQATTTEEARAVASRFRQTSVVKDSFGNLVEYWDDTLGVIQVNTPDSAMNMIVNRWLLYQTLSCRVWARSAFYQSGGAYGFRDQLQDVMALTYAKPDIARDQIIRAAQRQFIEGDVQHWWHTPTGRGVRTHFSDDLLWLPFVTSFYIEVTGDRSLLDEALPFIEAPPLDPMQESAYLQAAMSSQTATLLEHCLRALDRSLQTGAHGLPLMGSGDWNDGMNRVGHEGKGESVWVGWFLYRTLKEFIPLLGENETVRADLYRAHMDSLAKAIEENAWDGNWYRRAYFDDGSPLGSASNEECRIDSIVQSWAILSEAGNPQRAARAMDAVDQYLIDRGAGLVKLFTPPFDKSAVDPGYIKGYVPGVRENGGQYTHAAIWTLMAFAKLGNGDRAGELYTLLNPINHSATIAGLHKYKVEPYVAAADIYGMVPHVGRGGWTWYTGSSSWMYRAALESILGFELRGNLLRIRPCIPKSWREFDIDYKFGMTAYHIVVTNNEDHSVKSVQSIDLDGKRLESDTITLVDDGKAHVVCVRI